jgi:hypothetical protein
MSKPPELTQIRPEDFKQEDQEMAGILAGVLNNFILQITQLLNQSLTFGDNFSSEIKELTVKGDASVTFKLNTVTTPVGLLLLQFRNTSNPTTAESSAVSTPQWSYDGRGNITIQQLQGLTAADTYVIKVLVISG